MSIPSESDWTPRAERIIQKAHDQAKIRGLPRTGVEHLLYAILEEGDSVAYAAIENVASPKAIGRELARILESDQYLTTSRNNG